MQILFLETIFMKYQILFPGKNEKKVEISCAENFTQSAKR